MFNCFVCQVKIQVSVLKNGERPQQRPPKTHMKNQKKTHLKLVVRTGFEPAVIRV